MRKLLPLAVLAFGLTGCYHATIETGRPPNGVVIRNAWAHSFVGGLVPPKVVETASRCPNGVSRVETQHSLLNMVASGLTWGIYSPMEITVECTGATTLMTPENTVEVAPEALASALEWAANESKKESEPFYVKLER